LAQLGFETIDESIPFCLDIVLRVEKAAPLLAVLLALGFVSGTPTSFQVSRLRSPRGALL